MTKNQKLTAGIVAVLVGAGIIYFGFHVFKKMNKENAIKLLMAKNPNRNQKLLEGFEANYLIAWAEASDAGKENFQYNGKTYSTQTGTAI